MSKGFNRISYKKLDVNKIYLPNLLKETTKKNNPGGKPPKTYIGFCKYGDSEESARNLIIQLPPLRIDWGGIPGEKDQIFESDIDKAKNVKIPLDVHPEFDEETDKDREKRRANVEKCKKYFVDKIDDHMESDNAKKQLFGSIKEAKKKKFLYSKLCKSTKKAEDDGEDGSEGEESGGEESGNESEEVVEETSTGADGKPKYKPEFYFKCRVPWTWDAEKGEYDLNKVKTTVVIVNDEKKHPEEFKKDGKYSHMEVTDLASLRSYMCYGSTVRIQLQLSNAFGCKETSPMVGNKRSYGLRWKLNRLLIDRDDYNSTLEFQERNSQKRAPQIDIPSDDEDEEMADNLLEPSNNDGVEVDENNSASNSGDEQSLEVEDDEGEEPPVTRRRGNRKRVSKA